MPKKECANCPGRNGCPKPGEVCEDYDRWAKLTYVEALSLSLTDAQIEKQRYKEVLEIIAGEKVIGKMVVVDPVAYAKSILHPKPPEPVDSRLPF